MIANEMIDVAAKAAWMEDYSKGWCSYQTYESTEESDKDAYRQDARIILTAAYPLIRKQVLFECLACIEDLHNMSHSVNDGITGCEETIRELINKGE